MKRGKYTGDRIKELKFRGSPKVYKTIKSISEEKQMTIAAVLRDLLEESLERRLLLDLKTTIILQEKNHEYL